MNDIKFVNNTTGFLVGDENEILKTIDTGANWTVLDPGLSDYLFLKICFINPDEGWVLSKKRTSPSNVISKTTNGGIDWTNYLVNENISGIQSIQFSDSNNGWICGSSGKVYATTNGGQNWIKQESLTNRDFYSVNFVDNNTGWLIGDKGTILKTTSGAQPVGINSTSVQINKNYSLSQNYPNPFNPRTIITYSLP